MAPAQATARGGARGGTSGTGGESVAGRRGPHRCRGRTSRGRGRSGGGTRALELVSRTRAVAARRNVRVALPDAAGEDRPRHGARPTRARRLHGSRAGRNAG